MTGDVSSAASEAGERQKAAGERAIRAWVGLAPDSKVPARVETLKPPRHRGKSVVLGLGAVGPGGMHVVAKELLDEDAHTELAVYRHVLPRLSVRGPELIGFTESERAGRTWLFLEAVTGARFDKSDRNHVARATLWVATLHAETASGSFGSHVPRRGPDHYTALMRRAVSGLAEVSSNQALTEGQRGRLQKVSALLDRIRASSERFADAYSTLPGALVHGDFKGNNMAFSMADGARELRVFDWSESHWGPMAVDVWSIDSFDYQIALERRGLIYDSGTIEQWMRFGSVLRWASAIFWEIPRLRYPWVERPMRRMTLFESRLRAAIESSPWLS
jgi:hypothetical protein